MTKIGIEIELKQKCTRNIIRYLVKLADLGYATCMISAEIPRSCAHCLTAFKNLGFYCTAFTALENIELIIHKSHLHDHYWPEPLSFNFAQTKY